MENRGASFRRRREGARRRKLLHGGEEHVDIDEETAAALYAQEQENLSSDQDHLKTLLLLRTPSGHPPLVAERALRFAVLKEGILVWFKNHNATGHIERILFNEAEYWMQSGNRDSPFSFVCLCEEFGFDPAAVRQALVRLSSAAAANPIQQLATRADRLSDDEPRGRYQLGGR